MHRFECPGCDLIFFQFFSIHIALVVFEILSLNLEQLIEQQKNAFKYIVKFGVTQKSSDV